MLAVEERMSSDHSSGKVSQGSVAVVKNVPFTARNCYLYSGRQSSQL